MRKEIECVNPTNIDQVLQYHMVKVEEATPSGISSFGPLGTYSFGIGGQQVYIKVNQCGDLVVDFGHLCYGTVSLGTLHTLELVEARLHKAGLLPRNNAIVVKAKMFRG